MKLQKFLFQLVCTILVIFFLGQLLTHAQSPNHEIVTQTVHYSITGSTPAQLRSAMNQRGPIHPPNGRRYDAYTNWNVRWNYNYRIQQNRCRIASARVRTEVKYTLPRWEVPANPSASLRNSWNNYLQALQVHENGHGQNGINAGKEILQMLPTMPGYATCEQLGIAANAAGDRIIEKYSQQDIEYDRLTQHGVTQGATFP